MRAVDLLLRGRLAAEALMLDACTITRLGEPVTDADGNVTDSTTPVYEGRCKVQSKDTSTSTPDAAGATFTVVSRQVHIPADDNLVVKDGDVVTITAAAQAIRVGKQYRVEGFTPDTFDTAFRLPVKENL